MVIDRDHLDVYIHVAHEWKIGLYDDGIDYCDPYNGYKYGVENKSTMASRKRPDRLKPPILGTVKSLEAVDEGATSYAGKGKKKIRNSLASRVPAAISPTSMKSRRGTSHKGANKNAPSGSHANPPPPIVIPSSPTAEVTTLIEDYAFGDMGGVTTAPSLACTRQIDFVDLMCQRFHNFLCMRNCSKSTLRLQLKFLILSLL